MHRIAGWWDGFELWVAGLPFIPQFFVVLIGMVPISFAIAVVLDRTLREVMRLLGRDRAVASVSGAGSAVTVGAPAADAAAVVGGPVADPREPVRSGAR